MKQTVDPFKIKEKYYTDRERIFNNPDLSKDSFQFCIKFTVLVEEYIIKALKGYKLNCAIASVGSFSRRELSPFSDIDLMFIFENADDHDQLIKECITRLWDSGIEVSHTVRDFSDIDKFLEEDLHSYTQFFETRFILGNSKIYNAWNDQVFKSLNDDYKKKLILEFFEDIKLRHKKFGESAKVLEPNVKYTAGALRDLQVVEWMYCLKNNLFLTSQKEITQTEIFFDILKKNKILIPRAIARLTESYKLLLATRNQLHLLSEHKNDRLEFTYQEKIANIIGFEGASWQKYMKKYFDSANNIKRFSRTMMKRFEEEVTPQISDHFMIELDDDFSIKNSVISIYSNAELTFSIILRACYYRGLHDARFDENLRTKIIEAVIDFEETQNLEYQSSVFFREILNLHKNVGKTLDVMNELGIIGAFMSEFKDLVGFFQPGVYHCYTADEHTLIALSNLEKLGEESSILGKLFQATERKDLLYLGVLFHDIAKPISISGHEVIGAEIANSVMERLGYDQNEIQIVQFLVRYHLNMEQVAFRRNLNDATTLNNFVSLFPNSELLDLLYLLTYADLSAVSQVVWTQWKSDLLFELYSKSKTMIDERLSGQDLLSSTIRDIISSSEYIDDDNFKDHIEAIDDLGYLQNFSQDEINKHIEEIQKGIPVSVFFKEVGGFTSITIITRDAEALLSRLCGTLSINDLNIHDAKIFTRKDGIVIDNFNVTDFRTGTLVDESRYHKITNDLNLTIENQLQITKEFSKIKSKWWRIENKLFKRKGKIKIEFEKHDKFTIIDVYSPDRLGLLYQITKKINELGLSIYFAKINTKADDIVDSFYLLTKDRKKISPNDYQLITFELTETINEML
ncbi:MAG: HD domain-containing protein [Ignavibacteria bacterium]|nr:HD domain-containing protein [Ignavibacteria bacterium]